MINQHAILPILATQRISLSPAPLPPPKAIPDFAEDYGHRPTRQYRAVSPYAGSQEEMAGTIEENIYHPEPIANRDFNGNIKVNFLIKPPAHFDNVFETPGGEEIKFVFMILREADEEIIFKATRGHKIENIMNLAENNSVPMVTKTMSEILLQNTAQTETQTNTTMDYQHQIHSSVDIEFDGENISSLQLFCFSMIENIPDLGSIAGNYSYDLLLESEGEGSLGIPLFREVFYINSQNNPELDLEPYYGPVIHRSEDNPGTGGFVGWRPDMSGAQWISEGKPTLEVRRIRNYKVISSTHSFISEEEVFSISSMSGPSEHSTGNALDYYLNSILDIDDIVNKSLEIRERAAASTEAHGRSIGPSFITRGTADTADIQVDTSGLENSCYRSIMGIDFLNIIKYNSAFGDLLCFQHRSGNTQFVRSSVYYSQILNIIIKRRRITEDPHYFNDVDNKIYTKFNENTPDLDIIACADISPEMAPIRQRGQIKNRLLSARSTKAALNEIDLLEPQQDQNNSVLTEASPYIRNFVLRDYDLFHNIDIGKYTYIVEITIRDGVPLAIEDIIKELDTSISDFEKYIQKSEIPVTRSPDGRIISGNFDMDTLQMSEEFKNDEELIATVNRSVNSYVNAAALMSGKRPRENQIEQMKNQLYPGSFNIESVLKFRRVMNLLRGNISNLLKTYGTLESRSSTFHSYKNNPALTPGSNPGTISVESKTNIVLDSFTPTTVMSDYGVSDLVNIFNRGLQNVIKAQIPYIPFYPSVCIQMPKCPTVETFSGYLDGQKKDKIVDGQVFFPQHFFTVDPVPFSIVHDGIISVDNSTVRATGNSSKSPDTKKIEKNIKAKSPGGINFVSSKKEFDKFTSNQKSTKKIELATIKKSDSAHEGTCKKGALFHPFALQAMAGIDFNLIGRGFRTNIYENFQWNNIKIPEMKQELVDSICASIVRGENEEEYVESNYESFSTLIETRKNLRDIFNNIHEMMKLSDAFLANISPPTPEKVWQGIETDTGNSIGVRDSDPFVEEFALPLLHSSKSESIRVDPSNLKIESGESTHLQKKFVFMRLERGNNNIGTTPVNTSVMLEI